MVPAPRTGAVRDMMFNRFETAYIRRRRLEEACRALVAPHRRMTVTEIATRWQFADSGHFARAFRKYYGRTPTDYAATAARETDAT